MSAMPRFLPKTIVTGTTRSARKFWSSKTSTGQLGSGDSCRPESTTVSAAWPRTSSSGTNRAWFPRYYTIAGGSLTYKMGLPPHVAHMKYSLIGCRFGLGTSCGWRLAARCDRRRELISQSVVLRHIRGLADVRRCHQGFNCSELYGIARGRSVDRLAMMRRYRPARDRAALTSVRRCERPTWKLGARS